MSALKRVAPVAIIIVAVGWSALYVLSVAGPLGGNDRARWLTVRSLVETGEFSIGERIAMPGGWTEVGLVVDRRWRSEDVVLEPDTQRFYSGKPPLLAMMAAGPVLVLQSVAGVTLADSPALFVRLILFALNTLGLLLALVVVLSTLRRLEVDTFAQTWTLAAIGLGTPLLAFSPVFTNHVPGALAALIAAALTYQACTEERPSNLTLIASGFFAGAAAALENPAAVLVLYVVWALGRRHRRRALAMALPAAAVPLAFFALGNWLAYGGPLPVQLGSGNWFRFAGSYWENPVGFDRRPDGATVYAFHLLFGHHGFFSLSPALFVGAWASLGAFSEGPHGRRRLFVLLGTVIALSVFVLLGKTAGVGRPALGALLALVGGAAFVATDREDNATSALLPRLAYCCALPTIGFYLASTANYGGSTVAARWLIWLAPLLLLAAAPALHGSGRRARVVATILLLLSVGSTAAMGAVPWEEPWPLRLTGSAGG